MILIHCTKLIIISICFFPMAFGALGTGILFGQFLIAASRNPNEYEKMYGTCLTAFALIETFSFLSIITAIMAITLV